MLQKKRSLFVSCLPKTEDLLLEELEELGIGSLSKGELGVFVKDATQEDCLRINYASRIASRVLLNLRQFRCNGKQALYKEVGDLPWETLFPRAERTLAIRVTGNDSPFKNSLYAAQLAKDAICDRLRETTGNRPSVDLKNPDIQLYLHFEDRSSCTLYLDTSGHPLYKRKYRKGGGVAPLQENFAAAILRLAKYDGKGVFLDPCCGSGTLLIEAAMIATRTPAGFYRSWWAFQILPGFDHNLWEKIQDEFDSKRGVPKKLEIYGIEKDSKTYFSCLENVKNAQFKDKIQVEQISFQLADVKSAPQWIVTNPPHGIRLREESPESLSKLYRDLGDFMKQKSATPARGFVLIGDISLVKKVGLATEKRHILYNNGVECRLLEYDLF